MLKKQMVDAGPSHRVDRHPERGKARNQLLHSQRSTSTQAKAHPPTTGCQCSYMLQPQLPAWSQSQVPVSQQWDVFAGLWGRRKTVGQQRHAGVGERTGERASESRSGLTGFTGSRWKLCEHDCAGLSLPPAASRHSTPKRAGPVGSSLNSPRPASLEEQKAFDE